MTQNISRRTFAKLAGLGGVAFASGLFPRVPALAADDKPAAAEKTVPAASQEALSLTVYKDDLALERDRRTVVLDKGANTLAFEGVAAKLLAELRPGSRVVTHMFRMPAEWEGRLQGTHSVGQCRPGGVDTSAFTRCFLYQL